jgi:hypoxanthine phosphoribosyltransferase
MAEKLFVTWDQIEEMVDQLIAKLPRDFDAILAITRGGMVPACLVSERLNMRNIMVAAVMFYTGLGETRDEPIFLQFPADPLIMNQRVLIVDDVWDSGKTAVSVRERVLAAGGWPLVAVLHYKPTKSRYELKPDYYLTETDDWIVYPWDRLEFTDDRDQGEG